MIADLVVLPWCLISGFGVAERGVEMREVLTVDVVLNEAALPRREG